MNYDGFKRRQKGKQVLALAAVLLLFAAALLALDYADAVAGDGVKLNKNNITLTVGKTQKLKVMQLPENSKATWKSSKKSVASVSRNGLVKAKKVGNATINCEIKYQKGKTVVLQCKVTVKKKTAKKKSIVYMTTDITPEGLMSVYKALKWEAKGNVAVKVSTGEPPASHYLDPELIKDLVQYVNGTIVECNTAYGGSRSSTALHQQVAKEHGFTKIAKVDIMDSAGNMSLPVKGGKHLKEDYVGKHFADYDSFLVLSHFKGHTMAGFGGAIKNISIGIASSKGKSLIHSGGTSTSGFGGNQNAFLESMAEAGKAVSDYLGKGKNIVYVNVMNNLSVDCDCDGNPAKPEMKDIGILASTDPVALDQACVDLVYKQGDGDGASLVKRIESRNGLLTLEHAEKINLGSRNYKIKSVE